MVVVAHADRELDAGVHEQLQVGLGLQVVHLAPDEVGEVAEHEHVARQRTHLENLGDGRLQPVAGVRLLELPGLRVRRVVAGDVDVREEDGEVLVEILRRGGEEASAGRVRPGGEDAAEEPPARKRRAHFFSSSTAW